jgi:deoxyinosine 3'endonuclease (endonuclease V)
LGFSWCEEEENFKNLSLIGGVDLSFHPTNPQLACANLVILNYPELKVICVLLM